MNENGSQRFLIVGNDIIEKTIRHEFVIIASKVDGIVRVEVD